MDIYMGAAMSNPSTEDILSEYIEAFMKKNPLLDYISNHY